MTNMSTPDLTHDWVPRALDLPGLLAKRSHFLLGPRQTGKTSLVHRSLKDAKVYDLLDTSVYLALNQNPGRLAEELAPGDRIVVIDEIQRLPELLNEVHRLIETDRKSTRLNSSHRTISYAVFCLKKKKKNKH